MEQNKSENNNLFLKKNRKSFRVEANETLTRLQFVGTGWLGRPIDKAGSGERGAGSAKPGTDGATREKTVNP